MTEAGYTRTTRQRLVIRTAVATTVLVVALWGVFGVQRNDQTGLRSVSDTERLLAEIGPGHHLAYAVEGGVTLIDFDTGLVQRVAQYADELTVLPPFLMLYNGNHTVVIDPDVPGHLRVFVTGSRAIATDVDGTFAFASVDESTGVVVEVFAGRNDASWIGQTLTIPPGATTIAVQDLGLLVTLPDGATLVPGITEFEQVADGTVIAAVPDAWVEVRCAEDCQSIFVDRVTGDEFTLPTSTDHPGVALSISPDGRWLVEATEESSRFVDPRTGGSVDILGGGGADFTWAPDSSYAIWLSDGASAPVTHFAFTDGRPPVAISLAALDAEPKVGSAVLLY